MQLGEVRRVGYATWSISGYDCGVEREEVVGRSAHKRFDTKRRYGKSGDGWYEKSVHADMSVKRLVTSGDVHACLKWVTK